LSENAKPRDIIFNEILFNPPPFGSDYLELYNRSDKTINCNELYIAGKAPDGNIREPLIIEKHNRSFFPGDYLVLTEDAAWVKNNFLSAGVANILQMHALPSLPDDKGGVVLMNGSGEMLDDLEYDHHPWRESEPIYQPISHRTGLPLQRPRASEHPGIKTQSHLQTAPITN
jgi:hypothetical protein